MRLGVGMVRRWSGWRRSIQWAVPVVVVLVAVFDDTDTHSRQTNSGRRSCTCWTYTWNWYVQTNACSHGSDLGHLWYLSVDMQAFVT